MTENFDTVLQALRERFIGEDFPQDEGEDAGFAAFSALSSDEKLKKVTLALTNIDKEINDLSEKMDALQPESEEEINDIKVRLQGLNFKHEILEHKIELLKNIELVPAKREKMKRQLAQLEIKRCKNLLVKKNCSKIDAKIAHKKEIFKKVFG